MARISDNIDIAADLLFRSDLVGIPTETVYGLAGNAYDPRAVARIFQVKDRPSFDPLIVHTPAIDQLTDFVSEVHPKARKLATHFWPGPLTLILRKKPVIPDLVTSGLETVAVRVPNHPLTLELLKRLPFPLAAPSANPFGYISPTTASHVNEQLGDKIRYILDGGPCRVGIESTIISVENDEFTVLRLGGCKIEEIEKLVGKVKIKLHTTSNPVSPGMLESHYAPMTPLVIGDIETLMKTHEDKIFGLLSFNNAYKGVPPDRQFVLSEKADLEEAATRLFIGLRQLDVLNLQLIIAEYVPEEGLGRAINDRLTRAKVRRS